jgi:hypothetical protein
MMNMSQKEIVLISSWINTKTFHMIKITKTFKKNKMCTSYLNHPTEHPQAGPNPDPLEIQTSICVVINHQHLGPQPVEK